MSKNFPLTRGDGFKIPELEQYLIVRCGNWSAKNWTYQRFHIRLTGEGYSLCLILHIKL